MDPRSAVFASPFPQTPTPGGSSVAHQYGHPPLTSLKPFGYVNTPKPALVRKPHPLTQVSMIEGVSTDAENSNSHLRKWKSSAPRNDITLSRAHNDPHKSLEDDLREFEREQKKLQHNSSLNPQKSYALEDQSSEGTEDLDTYGSHLSEDSNEEDDTEEEDEEEEEEDEEEEEEEEIDEEGEDDDYESEDLSSLRIGLSSLSPPGIGRAAPRGRRLSADELLGQNDLSFQVGQEFSRELDSITLSPIRQTGSGFEVMAGQIRRDFEKITGQPSPSRSRYLKKKKSINIKTIQDRGGTLKGTIPTNGDLRAKRVFGAEANKGLKPPRIRQLHSAGLSSTPPAKALGEPGNDISQHLNKTGLLDFSANASSVRPQNLSNNQPIVRIQDASSETVLAAPANSLPLSKIIERPVKIIKTLNSGTQKAIGNSVHVPDVTGLTEALRSPQKANFHLEKPLDTKASGEAAQPDPTLNEALRLLRRRLSFLEAENKACESRIRDLQQQLNCVRKSSQAEADGQRNEGLNEQRERSVRQSTPAIERMVQKLKVYTRRLNNSIEAHAVALEELNNFKNRNRNIRQEFGEVKTEVRQWSAEVEDLKHGLVGLTIEVREIRTMVEGLMKTTQAEAVSNPIVSPAQPGMCRRGFPKSKSEDAKPVLSKAQSEFKRKLESISQPHHLRAQSENSRNDIEQWRSQASTPQSHGRSFIRPDEIERLRNEVAHQKSTKAVTVIQKAPQTNIANFNNAKANSRTQLKELPLNLNSNVAPPTRVHSAPNLKTTFGTVPPAVSTELSRGEAILNSLPKAGHDDTTCSQCRLRRQGLTRENANKSSDAPENANKFGSAPIAAPINRKINGDDKEPEDDREGLPPQTVLVNILRELEEDFEIHRKIFVELSDTYKKMNPASTLISKRRALAQHLKESVDTLEKKAGHIKHLYDLLHFKDLPIRPGTEAPDWGHSAIR
ncbi:hypothetical protein BY996DRAFT_4581232 [Phakopsora pachyrhizi]|nr:hypothetical protein BY996DRAFT_4581232 [Phakopsora pachyrhizi]